MIFSARNVLSNTNNVQLSLIDYITAPSGNFMVSNRLNDYKNIHKFGIESHLGCCNFVRSLYDLQEKLSTKSAFELATAVYCLIRLDFSNQVAFKV